MGNKKSVVVAENPSHIDATDEDISKDIRTNENTPLKQTAAANAIYSSSSSPIVGCVGAYLSEKRSHKNKS